LRAPAPPCDLAFRPDGRVLVAVGEGEGEGEGGALHWYDAATGQPLCRQPGGTRERTSPLAISPDGLTLVTGRADKQVVRWDLVHEQIVGPALPHGSPVRKVAFLGDNRRIVVATRDGQVRVWDLASLRVSVLPPEGMAVTSLAVSPDHDRFAT